MRTTLALNDQLARRAKKLAAESGTTLTALIEDALRVRLATYERRTTRRVHLPTFHGTGVRADVDLSRTSSVLDLLDREGD
jgi:hypothetical protein